MSQETSQQEIPLRFTSHPDPSVEVASYPNITGFPFSQTWEFITEQAGHMDEAFLCQRTGNLN